MCSLFVLVPHHLLKTCLDPFEWLVFLHGCWNICTSVRTPAVFLAACIHVKLFLSSLLSVNNQKVVFVLKLKYNLTQVFIFLYVLKANPWHFQTCACELEQFSHFVYIKIYVEMKVFLLLLCYLFNRLVAWGVKCHTFWWFQVWWSHIFLNMLANSFCIDLCSVIT